MRFKDYYIILELNSNATKNDIKKSYRKLAHKHHPDKNFGNKYSETKFKEIQEAYEILSDETAKQKYDYEYYEFYNAVNKNNARQNNNPNEEQAYQESSQVTPNTYLELFHQLHRQVFLSGTAKELDKLKFYNYIKEILNEKAISFLQQYGNLFLNRQIIKEILQCCDLLELAEVRNLSTEFVKIVKSDNETIQIIDNYIEERSKVGNNRNIVIISIIAVAILTFVYFKISRPSNSLTEDVTLDGISTNPYSTNLPPDIKQKNNSKSIMYENTKPIKVLENYSDWELINYETGNTPGCYNFLPIYSKSLNNELEVTVGTHTDVVLKLIRFSTKKCIRYVYIKSGDIYSIRNIPEGKYYLKIAYGRDWRQKSNDGKCIGKFTSNVLYKKGDDVFDFTKEYKGLHKDGDKTYRSYNIPSYSLKLDVITKKSSNEFKTDEISEDEFNEDQ